MTKTKTDALIQNGLNVARVVHDPLLARMARMLKVLLPYVACEYENLGTINCDTRYEGNVDLYCSHCRALAECERIAAE